MTACWYLTGVAAVPGLLLALYVIWGILEGIVASYCFITEKKYYPTRLTWLMRNNVFWKWVEHKDPDGADFMTLFVFSMFAGAAWPAVLVALLVVTILYGGRALHRFYNKKER